MHQAADLSFVLDLHCTIYSTTRLPDRVLLVEWILRKLPPFNLTKDLPGAQTACTKLGLADLVPPSVLPVVCNNHGQASMAVYHIT